MFNRKAFSFFLEIFEANLEGAAMLFQNAEGRERYPAAPALSPLEVEAIEMFINFLRIIGLQKSVGEIYGLLFVAARPLSMDDIVNRLHISMGASQPGTETPFEAWEQSKPSIPRGIAAIISQPILN